MLHAALDRRRDQDHVRLSLSLIHIFKVSRAGQRLGGIPPRPGDQRPRRGTGYGTGTAGHSDGRALPLGTDAVSYTHLDVYKRQIGAFDATGVNFRGYFYEFVWFRVRDVYC